ncbi:MAG: NADP-dependent oxidoreductase [Spirochaetia bacterium]
MSNSTSQRHSVHNGGTGNREIRLKRNPVGLPEESDFELVETEIPRANDGEVLVRNRYMSVDPYMRGRIAKAPSYADNWKPGETMRGGCVGEVVESRDSRFSPGDFVVGERGWRDYYTAPAGEILRVDPDMAPLQAYLGVLGMPGLTAYVGLLKLAGAEKGETVYVSAAAGAVGSLVCQLARLEGCRVVASAGSDAKIAWLRDELGVDSAFNYKNVEDLSGELATRSPEGLHIYFDNVGTTQLEAAIDTMRMHGRILCCGMISAYNAVEPPAAPRNLFQIVGKRLSLRGFIVRDHQEHYPEFISKIGPLVRSGEIKYRETLVDGLENAPSAFISLFHGVNIGKMVVRVG